MSNKYVRKNRRSKSSMKTLALLLSVVLIMGAVIGGSLAYLQTNSTSITNSFTPGHVGCVVENDGNKYTVKPDKDTNTPVKLRAAIVANWVLEDTPNSVYWQAPTVTVTEDDSNTTDWDKENDGFYYYAHTVEPGKAVEAFSVTTTETPPTGYVLQIQVLGEAIQAKPDEAPAVWTNGG